MCSPEALTATKPQLGVIQRPRKANSNTRGNREKRKMTTRRGPRAQTRIRAWLLYCAMFDLQTCSTGDLAVCSTSQTCLAVDLVVCSASQTCPTRDLVARPSRTLALRGTKRGLWAYTGYPVPRYPTIIHLNIDMRRLI